MPTSDGHAFERIVEHQWATIAVAREEAMLARSG
jgi:hypothetical protein